MVLLLLCVPLIAWAQQTRNIGFTASPTGIGGVTTLPGTNWNVDKLNSLYTAWRTWTATNTLYGGYVRHFDIPSKGDGRYLASKDIKGLNIANAAMARGGTAAVFYESSTIEGFQYKPEYAFDGDMDTRWASHDPAVNGPETLSVDLGEEYNIAKIVLKWEAAYASKYTIEISTDGTTWGTLYFTSNGDGLVDDIDGQNYIARYIRLICEERATPYGYSLFEFEVYADVDSVAADGTYTASSIELEIPNLHAWKAFDGDFTTRWGSEEYINSDQWLQVNLNGMKTVNRVVLHWETAFGAEYQIQANNGGTWLTLASITGGDGNIDAIDFTATTTDKLRLLCTKRGSEYGYSLYEMQVYETDYNRSFADGCIIQMSPNGKASEMSMSASTSEAMGYGMILAVLANDLDVFTGLWKVVQAYGAWHPEGAQGKLLPDLMSWCVPCEPDPNNSVTYTNEKGEEVTEHWPLTVGTSVDAPIVGAESNLTNNFWAATDGEMDIAYALILAYDKWGDEKYKEAAYKRMRAIEQYLVGTATVNGQTMKFLNTGNCFGIQATKPEYNGTTANNHCFAQLSRPCDWMLANLNEMSRIGMPAGMAAANNKIYANIDILKNIGTYLLPDFAKFTEDTVQQISEAETIENEIGDRNYSWNSARVPWRNAQNVFYYQDDRSRQVCYKIVNTLKSDLEGDGLYYGYYSADATKIPDTYRNPAFTIPALLAAQTLTGTDLADRFNAEKLDLLWKKHLLDKHYALGSGTEGGDYAPYEKNEYNANVPSKSNYFGDAITLICGAISLNCFPPHEFYEEKIVNGYFETNTNSWTATKATLEATDIDNDGDQELVISCNAAGDIILRTTTKELEKNVGFGLSFTMTKATTKPLTWTMRNWNIKEFNLSSGANALEFKLGDIQGVFSYESGFVVQNNVMRFKGDIGFSSPGAGEKPLLITIKDAKAGDIFILDNIRLQDPPITINRYLYIAQWNQSRSYNDGSYVRYNGVTYECVYSYGTPAANTRPGYSPYWRESTYGEIGSKWQKYSTYQTGDYVYYQGTTYQALAGHTSYNNPQNDKTKWTYYFSREDEGFYPDIPDLGYPAWVSYQYYSVGNRVSYNGSDYECTYYHQSGPGYEPSNPAMWALWKRL